MKQLMTWMKRKRSSFNRHSKTHWKTLNKERQLNMISECKRSKKSDKKL